jgi:uncharacterized protein
MVSPISLPGRLADRRERCNFVLTAFARAEYDPRVMQAPLLPREVDLKRLGSARHAYEGEVPVEALAELQGAGERPGPVRASIMLDLTGSMPRMTGRCQGSIQLQCQRCLEPVDVALESEFELVVVDRASDADGLDEGQAWVEAPRGVLGLARFVEEEMLLALPVVARHENVDCDGGQRHFGPPGEPQPERDNPFAALKALREKGSPSNE